MDLCYLDCDPAWVEIVSSFLNSFFPGIVECFSDLTSAGRACSEHAPRYLVFELYALQNMEEMALFLSQATGRPCLIIFTSRVDDVAMSYAASNVVSGAVLKGENWKSDLQRALQLAGHGGRFFSPRIDGAIKQLRQCPHAFNKVLSKTELSMIPLFASALTDREIADLNNLSPNTVHAHRTRILKKLNLGSTPRLIVWAKQKGFVR
jgi:DNA-binding NarL/FixJ family response regulator